MTLKEIIKDNFVYFQFLRQGIAYYTVYVRNGEKRIIKNSFGEEVELPISDTYQFTIPLDDIGNGTLNHRMKAIECMRWIRKAQESNELIKL